MSKATDIDYFIIGGGFYGCCLALFLRSISSSIAIAESEDSVLQRASKINQARIHTGFHYPRNAVTAVKSLVLHERFAMDFPEAVYRDFQMLYAIARRRSKVSANRFLRMFREMKAPIKNASSSQYALFNSRTIEGVYDCVEYAFNYTALQEHLSNRMDSLNIDLRLDTQVVGIEGHSKYTVVHLSNGQEVRARYVFNVTYSKINEILAMAGLSKADLKYEFTEIALVEPPEELEGYGITVMDGPFFSTMPFPSENLYSLTHVRYTPHFSWTDDDGEEAIRNAMKMQSGVSKAKHMILDGQRYVPSLGDARWKRSLYEVKAVLQKNEVDDGRPILYQRKPADSRLISIMGGKIDNIYDLFDLIRSSEPEWAFADDRYIT